MTPNIEFARMLAAAELLSAERALVFTYDRDGWRVHPAAIYDPFDAAPLADADVPAVGCGYRRRPTVPLKPCGTRAAYLRHRAHGETPCDDCIRGCRDQERENKRRWYAKQRALRNESPDQPGDNRGDIHAPRPSPQAVYPPVLTTPSGAPMLISVAGQRESGAQGTAEEPASRRGETVPGTPDADAVTESEAS